MIVLKLLRVFSLGSRHIVSCHVINGNPMRLLGNEIVLSTSDGCQKKIRVDGVSTASDVEHGVYDLQFSGDIIESRDIENSTVFNVELADEIAD